ncbi:MAG: lipoyl synthase, partial [Coriobacteriia bacterium]|nr:lipoyl synthase [Coriobacteriia bacterium]
KTATFMIMGTRCTRNCRFCNVTSAVPRDLDPSEPEKVATAVARLQLSYVVVTSVTRDDLPDGGAAHFAATVRAIRAASPQTVIEILIPDFKGSSSSLQSVCDSAPDVISHNIETVPELYRQVRKGASYQRSLDLIATIKELNPQIRRKSGIMLGMGETTSQLEAVFDDLLQAGCELLTIGQYLAPSLEHYPVQEFIAPEAFEQLGNLARSKGFAFVASAPLVRSSYHAQDAL